MLYFAYCTLLDLNEMHKYCPAALPIGTGRLDEYRLTFATYTPGSTGGGCQLEAETGGEIFGVLYELTDTDVANLDKVSGVDKGYYLQVPVNIETPEGRVVHAITYIIPHPGGPFRPSPAYVRPILAGAQAVGLPEPYVEGLEKKVQAAVGG
jgi:gamma-glutamylcyclotransferase (GGCT)/AIG2-like uncharacterized protein YtfP